MYPLELICSSEGMGSKFSSEIWPFLAAIVTAFIGGAVSFIVTVLSKEQKTSEFRQAWIDALREDLANFASLIVVFHDMVKSRARRGESLESIEGAAVENGLADAKAVEMVRLRILFRLNPIEHDKLIKVMDGLYKHSFKSELDHPGTVDQLLKDFTIEGQRVLKSEWNRVKRGEPIFRTTKWGALGVVIVIVLIGLIMLSRR